MGVLAREEAPGDNARLSGPDQLAWRSPQDWLPQRTRRVAGEATDDARLIRPRRPKRPRHPNGGAVVSSGATASPPSEATTEGFVFPLPPTRGPSQAPPATSTNTSHPSAAGAGTLADLSRLFAHPSPPDDPAGWDKQRNASLPGKVFHGHDDLLWSRFYHGQLIGFDSATPPEPRAKPPSLTLLLIVFVRGPETRRQTQEALSVTGQSKEAFSAQDHDSVNPIATKPRQGSTSIRLSQHATHARQHLRSTSPTSSGRTIALAATHFRL